VKGVESRNEKPDPPSPRVIVVEGEDESTRVTAVRELLASFTASFEGKIVSSTSNELLVEKFEGSELLLSALRAAATPSLTGQPRAIVVQCRTLDVTDAQRVFEWISGAEVAERVPSPPAVVVICCERAPSQRARRILEAAGARIESVERLSYTDLPRFVIELAREAGLSLASDAAAYLAAVAGGDVNALKSAVAQLADAYPSGESKNRLGLSDLERIFDPARHDPPWVLIQAVERGDVSTALMSLEGFLDGGYHPLQVLAMLYTSCRRIAYLALAPVTHKELLASMKLPPSVRSRISSLARRLGASGSKKLLVTLAQAELDMKGDSGLDPRIVLEKLVVEVCELLGGRSNQVVSAPTRTISRKT